MSNQYTPGPWAFGVRKDGSIWLSIGDHKDPESAHYQGDLVASEADARLIVAAPKLLEALRELTARAQLVKELLAAEVPEGDPVHPASAHLTWPLSTALLAISEATGES